VQFAQGGAGPIQRGDRAIGNQSGVNFSPFGG